MKKTNRRLKLDRTSIRSLSDNSLERVDGATTVTGCYTTTQRNSNGIVICGTQVCKLYS
jgi:hypothetical protein